MGGAEGIMIFYHMELEVPLGFLGAMPIMQSRILREKERRRGTGRGKEREGEWEGERARTSTRQIKSINKLVIYLFLKILIPSSILRCYDNNLSYHPSVLMDTHVNCVSHFFPCSAS